MITRFDLLNGPLEGTRLIEASAGTGKTYALSGLVLRLILEKNLSIRDILVVTFTEAATQELKDRIRRLLREALGVLEGRPAEDPFLQKLMDRQVDAGAGRFYLYEALRSFDQAAIFTIHGFCRRVLHENAFESGSLFDTDLMPDQSGLKQQIVEDFWRRQFYEASPLFLHYVMGRKWGVDTFIRLLDKGLVQPDLDVIPRHALLEAAGTESAFHDAFARLRDAWPSAKREVEGILMDCEGLNRQRYGRGKIPTWIRDMDDYVSIQNPDPSLFKGFAYFTSGAICLSVKKNCSAPDHPFFRICESLKECRDALVRIFDHNLTGIKVKLFRYVQEELRRRKQAKNIQSFDDLLFNVRDALRKKGGNPLRRTIRARFAAALIDEFQDTDPVQYDIFKSIFDDEKGILFFIGDPKQAIYGFRGADVFAYLKASEEVTSTHFLDENWRSEPPLIRAANAIFDGVDAPFFYKKIQYHRTMPAARPPDDRLTIDGRSEPAFRLWFVDAEKICGAEKAVTREKAYQVIPESVAAEISRLIRLGNSGRAMIGREPLGARDIAVLVRRNAEAEFMKEALSRNGIPSVLFNTGNLFETREAVELERVMTAVAEPENPRRIHAALATDIMGLGGAELDELMVNEGRMEKWVVRFRAYHDIWRKRGFMVMFRSFKRREDVLSRLMAIREGERAVTNLLHLSEILQQAAIEHRLNMPGLLKWFSEQRQREKGAVETHPLRLESDENAVRLVTIHKSKGLEYPVVFCPFTWDGSRVKGADEPVLFHEEGDRTRLILDLGSPDYEGHRTLAEQERLAENLRLFYVALTRARNRCYLIWGRFNESETSAPAYLFHGGNHDGGRPVEEGRPAGMGQQDMLRDLVRIAERSEGAIQLSVMPMDRAEPMAPAGEKPAALKAGLFEGNIEQDWRISSFSSIVSGRIHSAEPADLDALSHPETRVIEEAPVEDERRPAEERETVGIMLFPRGVKAGTFFHDLFEHLDFRMEEPSAIAALVSEKLHVHGFDPDWETPVLEMVQRVLHAPLDPAQRDLRLSCLGERDRLNELSFYFPMTSVRADDLKPILERYLRGRWSAAFPEQIGRLQFTPVKGFMKGFIDLVFRFRGRYYLADWKSNFLGRHAGDYGEQQLITAMEEGYYTLQYFIYTVALHQYLRLRMSGYDYDDHFGGVYYIFIRGVDPGRDPNCGIFRDRPPGDLIEGLSELLIPKGDGNGI